MEQLFTTHEGALRRLMRIRREQDDGVVVLVNGRRKDGAEVYGVRNVLRDLRTGRLACFYQSSPVVSQVVFVS